MNSTVPQKLDIKKSQKYSNYTFLLFYPSKATIILSYGHSWPFWSDCGQGDSAVMHTVIVALSLIVMVLLYGIIIDIIV